jgi:hypothetical protein
MDNFEAVFTSLSLCPFELSAHLRRAPRHESAAISSSTKFTFGLFYSSGVLLQFPEDQPRQFLQRFENALPRNRDAFNRRLALHQQMLF